MTGAAERALQNIIEEWNQSTQSLNLRERISVARELDVFAMKMEAQELRLLARRRGDEIVGLGPLGGQ